MKKIIKFTLFLALFHEITSNLRSSIVVNVINSSQEQTHHFDYHDGDGSNKIIFRHSHNNNINHHHVTTQNGFQDLTVSGLGNNIAPSATKLINPQITEKKVQVNTEIYHKPEIISQPLLLGYHKQIHKVYSYDPFSGQILKKNVIVNTPKIGMTHKVNKF
jgi:hypothetical protein